MSPKNLGQQPGRMNCPLRRLWEEKIPGREASREPSCKGVLGSLGKGSIVEGYYIGTKEVVQGVARDTPGFH